MAPAEESPPVGDPTRTPGSPPVQSPAPPMAGSLGRPNIEHPFLPRRQLVGDLFPPEHPRQSTFNTYAARVQEARCIKLFTYPPGSPSPPCPQVFLYYSTGFAIVAGGGLGTPPLGLLRHRTASGYDLAREIDREERHLWRASSSQVYATLRRLERRGLVQSQMARSRKGPPRRLYSLRLEGNDFLQEFLGSAEMHGAEWVPWLARLRILDGADSPTAQRLLAQTHAGLLRESDRLRTLLEAANTGDNPTMPGFYRRATLECALSTVQLRLKWCERTLAQLAAALNP